MTGSHTPLMWPPGSRPPSAAITSWPNTGARPHRPTGPIQLEEFHYRTFETTRSTRGGSAAIAVTHPDYIYCTVDSSRSGACEPFGHGADTWAGVI